MINPKLTAEEVLKELISLLTDYLSELATVPADNPDYAFVYGEQTAFTECLEIAQSWEFAAVCGLDFDIEKRYPLIDKRRLKKKIVPDS